MAACDATAVALLQPAPLDWRVNALQSKREAVHQELRDAGITTEPTPHSPWGWRAAGKLDMARGWTRRMLDDRKSSAAAPR